MFSLLQLKRDSSTIGGHYKQQYGIYLTHANTSHLLTFALTPKPQNPYVLVCFWALFFVPDFAEGVFRFDVSGVFIVHWSVSVVRTTTIFFTQKKSISKVTKAFLQRQFTHDTSIQTLAYFTQAQRD